MCLRVIKYGISNDGVSILERENHMGKLYEIRPNSEMKGTLIFSLRKTNVWRDCGATAA